MTGLLFTFQTAHSTIPALLINKQAFQFLRLKTQMLQDLLGDFQAGFVLPVLPSSSPNFKGCQFFSLFVGLLLVLLFLFIHLGVLWFSVCFYKLSVAWALTVYTYISFSHPRNLRKSVYFFVSVNKQIFSISHVSYFSLIKLRGCSLLLSSHAFSLPHPCS